MLKRVLFLLLEVWPAMQFHGCLPCQECCGSILHRCGIIAASFCIRIFEKIFRKTGDTSIWNSLGRMSKNQSAMSKINKKSWFFYRNLHSKFWWILVDIGKKWPIFDIQPSEFHSDVSPVFLNSFSKIRMRFEATMIPHQFSMQKQRSRHESCP